MKFITILIICLIYLFKLNEALVLKSDQLIAAQTIIKTLFQISNYTDPCSYPNGMFTCIPSNGGTEYVVSIINTTLGNNTSIYISDSLEAFENVTVISLRTFSITIWTYINKFTFLKYLYIGDQIGPIATSTILPTTGTQYNITFGRINKPIPESFFTTGDMYSLIIVTPLSGFSFPTLSTVNTKLGILDLTLRYAYYPFPTNMNTKLMGLTDLYLTVYNDLDNGVVSSIPTFDTPFIGLNNFIVTFIYSSEGNLQKYTIPNSYMNTGANSFVINGKGLKLPNSGILDFSNYKNSSKFEFNYVGFLDTCTSKCLFLPKDSELNLNSNNMNMGYIDFTNIIKISVKNNQLSQPLPTLANIDLGKIENFSLIDSAFTGTIPSSYCKFKANTYSLASNNLSGFVPTCFSCVGANMDGTNNLFPNSFSDFNLTSTPSTCGTYSIDDIPSGTFKTNQDTVITISGTDFGWSTQIETTPIPAPTLSILVPNNKILFTIPKGYGTNKQLTANFGGNYQFTKQFTYSYEAPVLSSTYYWTLVNGNYVLTLIGTGFSYVNSNIIILNGTQITVPLAATSKIDSSKGEITLPASTTSKLSPGDTIVISVKVSDQTSKTVSLIYVNPISMTTKDLYAIGGSITFTGVFGVSSTTGVTLSIDDNTCIVNSITPTSITFTYPIIEEGDYDISLNIGGLDMPATQVSVIQPPKPTLLSKYSWGTIGDANVILLTGAWFGYYEPSPNSVLINGQPNVATIATASSSLGYDQITITEDVLSSLTAGDLFTIEVKVLNQISNSVNFNLIYPISMTTKDLYTNGGSISFTGVFSTSNKTLASLSIDGNEVTITELTPTSISFNYPNLVIGEYDLYLKIGPIDYSNTVTYIKLPTLSLLNNYSWRTLTGGVNVLVLTGLGFNYSGVNSVLINGVPFESTIAVASPKVGYDEITFTDDTITNSFVEDESFTVVVEVNGRKSNLVTFNFIKLISVNSVTLNTTGGDISFTGVYGTSNKSIVYLSINDIECKINSINPTTITFTYPVIINAGDYNFDLNIGGLSYYSIVKYINPVTPTEKPTTTSSTSSTTTSSTSTTSSSTTTSSSSSTTSSSTTTSTTASSMSLSDEDQPSNSPIKLSISYILSTLTFSLILIL